MSKLKVDSLSVFPIFKEYITAFNDNNYGQLFLNYMKNGGMSGNIDILKSNSNDIDKYLDGIFSTVVYKV